MADEEAHKEAGEAKAEKAAETATKSDSPSAAAEAAASPTASPKKSAPSAPPAVTIPSEEEIDSPDHRTLFLLSVIFAVTVGSWGAARFACNMHPPESRGAPKIATERLLGTAKDAAIEFIQRYRSSDFDGALETVSDDLVMEVSKAKEECAKRANECAREREASAGRLTTASVSKQEGFAAEAHVTTTLKGKTEKYQLIMKRDGMIWKAVKMTPE